MDNSYSQISVDKNCTISSAFQKMSSTYKRLFLVYDGEDFIGILSIGDIQRAIIAGVGMSQPVSTIMRSQYRYATSSQSDKEIKQMMLQHRMEFIPVLDNSKKLIKVIFWEDIIDDNFVNCESRFDLPIVIMAGGMGTRLKPITNVIPKPLIPINDKTILENIMDRFVLCGSRRFFLSVNYKADFIKSYFDQLNCSDYKICYFQESKPLGTAGSISLLKGKINSSFFVSNCDIIIEEDYSQILKYHRDNHNLLTMVTALKTIPIPYGVIETGDSGLLTKINEKPDLSIKINTGMYILEPELLNDIPSDQYFQITTLMSNIIAKGGKVGCFPVNENSWIDVGDWEEYLDFIKRK